MSGVPNAENEILSLVRTKADAREILGVLSALEDAPYESSDRFLAMLEKEAPFRISRIIRDMREQEKGDRNAVKRLCASIQERLAKMPVMAVDLAFQPSEDFLLFLSEWARKQTGESVLLDIRVVRAIGGGVRITFGGRYRERVLKARIDAALERESASIRRLL